MYQLFLFWYDILSDARKDELSLLDHVTTSLQDLSRPHLYQLRASVTRFGELIDAELQHR